MTEPRKASNGQPMTDEFWRHTEDKAEAGLDPSRLRRQRRAAATRRRACGLDCCPAPF